MWLIMSTLVSLIKYFWLCYLCYVYVKYGIQFCLGYKQYILVSGYSIVIYPTDLIFIRIVPYSFISSYFEKDYKLVLFIRVVMFSSNDKVFKKSRSLQKTST